MATVLRVKRRHSCEPLDTLAIACKKQKNSDDNSAETVDSENVTTVLKLAGTVQTQDDVVKQIAKTLSKEQLEENYKQKAVNITAKNRIQTMENSKQQRYKVISCFRSLSSDLPQLDEKGMTVIDVEDSVSCTDTKTSSDQENDYVYDLYYTKADEQIEPENFLTIYNPADDLVFDNSRDSPEFYHANDSDDSNSESNWRNEYPDSDFSEEESESDVASVDKYASLHDYYTAKLDELTTSEGSDDDMGPKRLDYESEEEDSDDFIKEEWFTPHDD